MNIKIVATFIAMSFVLASCAVKTTPGMNLTQLNSASTSTGNGNLVLVNKTGKYEIYQSSSVVEWKKQISQGNAVAKAILTPDKNIYYVIQNGAMVKEITGDAALSSFVASVAPQSPQAPSASKSNAGSSSSAPQAVKVANAITLASVSPRDPDFVYPIQNISVCNSDEIQYKRCIDINRYKQSCGVAKNISYQAARMAAGPGLPARLLEANGVVSNVGYSWEGNQCIFKYEVRGIFDGKQEGCRVYAVATAFAVGEPGGIVANRAYPMQIYKDSTCRLQ